MLRTIEDTKLTAIADAIREKGGTTEGMTVDGMPEAVRAISSGGVPEKCFVIMQTSYRTEYTTRIPGEIATIHLVGNTDPGNTELSVTTASGKSVDFTSTGSEYTGFDLTFIMPNEAVLAKFIVSGAGPVVA